MRALLAALLASTVVAAAPADAALVTLRFQGTIPSTNSFFGSGIGPFTTFQQTYFAAANWGNTYDFTLQYDSAAVPVAGRYAMTLVSGRVGSFTDFSGFAPYMQFASAGAYTYLNLFLQKDEMAGSNLYRSYAAFALGDNDGTVVAGVLPTTLVASEYNFINVSFETYGRDGSYRHMVDSQSRGLTQIANTPGGVGGVPEPATWAMMIAGFGMIGAGLRRRSVKVVYA